MKWAWCAAGLAAGCGIFLVGRASSTPPVVPPPVEDPVAVLRSKSLPPVAGFSPPDSRPWDFRWSQLESDEFPRFIANLRGIGCPDRTIRQIVAAELTEISQEGEGRSLNVPATLAWLMDGRPPGARLPLRQAVLQPPLVLSALDWESLGLNPGQIRAVSMLAGEFRARTGGEPPDGRDEAKLAAWRAAKAYVDQQTRAVLGKPAHDRLMLAALAPAAR